MKKPAKDLNHAIITNDCLQIIYVNSAAQPASETPPLTSKLYTEHLDIFLILQGQVDLKLFNQKKTLQENEIFICTQSTYTEFSINAEQPISYIRVRFIKGKLGDRSVPKRFAASLLNCDIVKQKIFNHCLSYLEFYEKSTKELSAAEATLVHQENIEILMTLEEMIHQEHSSLDIVRNNLVNNSLITSAVDIFEKHIDSALSMDDVIEKLEVSHSYFVRVFKRSLGVVPNVFWRTIKLNHSLSLISLRIESISEISYNLGFTDQSHFTNSFKKYLQITPGSL